MNNYPKNRKSPPPFTATARRNMSIALTGHPVSEETREKIRNKLKGRPRPDLRGVNAGNWRGGISPLRLQIRKCFEYSQWQRTILSRDDYTCQICSIRGGKLAIDHFPKSFSGIIRENEIKTLQEARECDALWGLDNGRTLCRPCHLKTDNYGAKSLRRK